MPQFAPSQSVTARATLPVKPAGLLCNAELYLGGRAATSGKIPFTSTGLNQTIQLPITMPSSGTYPVLLDITTDGLLIGAFYGTEDVVIAAPTGYLPVTLYWGSKEIAYIGIVSIDGVEFNQNGQLLSVIQKNGLTQLTIKYRTVRQGSYSYVAPGESLYFEARFTYKGSQPDSRYPILPGGWGGGTCGSGGSVVYSDKFPYSQLVELTGGLYITTLVIQVRYAYWCAGLYDLQIYITKAPGWGSLIDIKLPLSVYTSQGHHLV